MEMCRPLFDAIKTVGKQLYHCVYSNCDVLPERWVTPADCWNRGERGPSLVGSLGLYGTVQNVVFHTAQYLNSFVPIDQQAGQAAVMVACLLECISMYYTNAYL